MKFAHLGDCHLGGWRNPKLSGLNFESFQFALEKSKMEKVDFILIAGDLFDSAYPPIETIKNAFDEFRKLKESKIPVFVIAGSHDYSISGKSFLDVLEKAGFVKNVFLCQNKDGNLILEPTIYKNIAIYGYPGKKSGLEVYDIEKIKIQDAPGLFRILMLHTTLRDAVETLPIPAVNQDELPNVDYIALGHLHIKYHKMNRVYAGPTFPNNSGELESLRGGSFYIVDTSRKIERHEIKLKEFFVLDLQIRDALTATEEIIKNLDSYELKDKIFLLKLKGILERGKLSDIDFIKIESYVEERGVFAFLKNTTKLQSLTKEIELELKSSDIEKEIIVKFQEKNQHKLNELIDLLILSLQVEKKEDESARVFEDRLLSEIGKIIPI